MGRRRSRVSRISGTALKATERAIANTAAWLATHPDDNHVRTAYLGLVERKARPIDRASSKRPPPGWPRTSTTTPCERPTSAWWKGRSDRARPQRDRRLAGHAPDDNAVRTAYFGLVERKGTADQTERVLVRPPPVGHALDDNVANHRRF